MVAKRGIFIVLDGIDGCGKSTQARLLITYLKNKNKSFLLTHEPSELKSGKKLDKILHDKSECPSSKKLLKLFSADAKMHLKKEIVPALKKGKIVISDRYYYSTLAYQLQPEKWQRYALKFLKPDLVLLFDLPVSQALKRLKKKYAKKVDTVTFFEKKKILQEVRKKFLLVPKKLDEKIVLLDGSKSIGEIFQAVKKEVDKLIK